MYLPKVNLQQIQQFKEKYLNRNIVSYLICVVIASILWFLNTLSKDYLTEITYPVKYTNFPAGKYPVAELPTQIQLTVKAKGFALLGHSIRTSFLPITFNVGSYCNHALSDKAGIQEFILNTNDIRQNQQSIKYGNSITECSSGRDRIPIRTIGPEKGSHPAYCGLHPEKTIYRQPDNGRSRQYLDRRTGQYTGHFTRYPDRTYQAEKYQ